MKPLIELAEWSKKKADFECNCGNIINTTYKVGILRHNCGECWKKNLHVGSRIRELVLLDDIKNHKKSDKVRWQCSCGQIKNIAIKSVLNGLTSSCGCKQIKANIGSCDYRKPLLIDLKELYNTKFHSLTIIDERSLCLHKGSETIVKVECDCGRIKNIKLGSVTRGYTKSCGECSYISYNKDTIFGSLKLLNTINIGSQSNQIIECLCKCGNTIKVRADHLLNNKTTSCGKCAEVMHKWWTTKSPIKPPCIISDSNEKYPLSHLISYFLNSKLEPTHGVNTLNKEIKMMCLYCNNIFKSRLTWIYHSKICSCGCISNRISKLNYAIKSWFPEAELEYKIGNFSFDVKIDKLLIECHGLRYHSNALKDTRVTRSIDRAKMQIAKNNGYSYIMIYEDEINNNGQLVKKYLEHKLHRKTSIGVKIRPQKLLLKRIEHIKASEFLNEYHYIGACSAKYHFGAYYDNELIAVMSFSNPSRQNIHGIEMKRYAVNNNYTICGLASWMLRNILNKHNINKPIVSYSDNRLHDGKLYEKLGFVKVGQTKQDYYWVKNNKRYHKSALRKPLNCDTTESELRTSQGYYRIYDLGKTKWVLF